MLVKKRSEIEEKYTSEEIRELEKLLKEKNEKEKKLNNYLTKEEPFVKNENEFSWEALATNKRNFIKFIVTQDIEIDLLDGLEKMRKVGFQSGEILIGKGTINEKNELISMSAESSQFPGLYYFVDLKKIHIIEVIELEKTTASKIREPEAVNRRQYELKEERVSYSKLFNEEF